MLEPVTRVEPLGFEEIIPETLADLALMVQAEAAGLGRGLHPDSARELVRFVRIMNSYYSNLIEGHNARPRDIEAALAGAELAPETRPLAIQAAIHVQVQEWIDAEAQAGRLPFSCSVEFIRELHRRFYTDMPEEFRFHEWRGERIPIEPGAFRVEGQEVAVGRHQPPSGHRVPDFMAHFERRYRTLTRGHMGRILSIATAHHRLNYIHPFLDGNGRVSRLVTHAMLHEAGLAGHGLWSISRGLARGLREKGDTRPGWTTPTGPARATATDAATSPPRRSRASRAGS